MTRCIFLACNLIVAAWASGCGGTAAEVTTPVPEIGPAEHKQESQPTKNHRPTMADLAEEIRETRRVHGDLDLLLAGMSVHPDKQEREDFIEKVWFVHLRFPARDGYIWVKANVSSEEKIGASFSEDTIQFSQSGMRL